MLLHFFVIEVKDILVVCKKNIKKFGEPNYFSYLYKVKIKNKGAIRLTVSKYYLPSGKSISEIGVSPDIEISEGSDDFRFNTDTDNQLQFALKLLNS